MIYRLILFLALALAAIPAEAQIFNVSAHPGIITTGLVSDSPFLTTTENVFYREPSMPVTTGSGLWHDYGDSNWMNFATISPPTSLSIADGKIFISLKTGKVTLQGITSDKAGRLFWQAIEEAWPWATARKCPGCGRMVGP